MRNDPFPPILPQPLSTAQSCDYVDQQIFHREKTGPQLRGMAPSFSDTPIYIIILVFFKSHYSYYCWHDIAIFPETLYIYLFN